jgi:hypothetical protein
MEVVTKENIEEMISEHATNSVARMKVGDVTSCVGLFGSALWYSLTELERYYLFMNMVDMLVGEGELDLEFAGVNDVKETLYRKIKP